MDPDSGTEVGSSSGVENNTLPDSGTELTPSIDPDSSAEVGFNRGNGVEYYILPGSGTEQVLSLTNTSNVNMPGVWVFRVDGDGPIEIGGQ